MYVCMCVCVRVYTVCMYVPPTVVQGRGGVDGTLPRVFDMLQYCEKR